MHQLSAVIITFNEEANIAACIESVKSIADEILVLDSFSTDRTREICIAHGVRFEQHAFDGHIQQKNRAKNLARHQWVLSLDADEKPSEQLIQSIQALKQNEPNWADGYAMNRLNFFCGKPIKTCGWYPDRKLRLWTKDAGEWTGVNPHDRFELYPNKTQQFLQGDILHNTYPTRSQMVAQMNKFARIAAGELKHKPAIVLLCKMMFGSVFRFLRCYLFKLGFTDGKAGLDISLHQALEVFYKYRLALKLKNSN
jgi:glycosyltransferase involved in cell wall biosynthesis